MTLVQTEPKKIYLGNNELKAVYLGDTKIRPTIKDFFADFLIVGGGGAGGGHCVVLSSYGIVHTGGGGGGEVSLGTCCPIESSMCIRVGSGGSGADANGNGNNGTASYIGDLYKANGGFGGLFFQSSSSASNIRAYSGGRSGNGYNGSIGRNCMATGGGGGGAGGAGVYVSAAGGCGGPGVCGYGGGGGGGCLGYGQGGGGDGGDNVVQRCCSEYPGWSGCPATNCGGGGGGAGAKRLCSSPACTCMRGAGGGGNGVVEICYPANGSYGYSRATGGNCCYTCDGYCVHRFTSNGTFTIG